MPAGEPFSGSERHDLEQAVRVAEQICGLAFSVYVGGADQELRPFAEGLHARLPDPARTVLVMVDPAARWLEIVTGGEARRVLPDEDCRLAAMAMQSAFAGGDLVGGIETGVQQLAEHARKPAIVHTDEP